MAEAEILDPSVLEDLKERKRAIDEARKRVPMDPKEEAERLERANALTEEKEKQVVAWVTDAIETSIAELEPIRQAQWECYQVYKEHEPASYANKQGWQSRIVVPKPFPTVQYAVAVIRKNLDADFLQIHDAMDKASEEFWRNALESALTRAQFILKLLRASEMGFAIGQSLEVIPVWVPGKGLSLELVEPWKIHRDPDAPPEDPQGGLYWIHSEWIGLETIRAAEAAGRYRNISRAINTDAQQAVPDDPFMSPEAIAKRKEQIHEMGRMRKALQLHEYWGSIYDANGELLHDSVRVTMAGGRIISDVQKSPYRWHRWPGAYFSPLPDLLRPGGRGLLEGIKSLWEAMCNLSCLHEDAMKWIVNPETEINIDALDDPYDVEGWPGKKYLTKDTANGQQAIRPVKRQDPTGSVLANSQYYSQLFESGSFVNDAVAGLPGYRSDVTWHERAQNLNQGLSVFQLMGDSLEAGARHIIRLVQDTLLNYATPAELSGLITREQAGKWMPNGEIPAPSGSFRVTGLSAITREAEILNTLYNVIIPLSENPRFSPYINPYGILKTIRSLTSIRDLDVIADDEKAEAITRQLEAEAAKSAEFEEKMTRIRAITEGLGSLEKLEGLLSGFDRKGGADGTGTAG